MRRAALLLAILTALLLGAPSVVLAAPPNRLEASAADPATGTTLTTFRFSVRYVSSTGNPAGGVTAGIGPLDVPLRLSSGTATDGTWSGSALLPAGTWRVTYRATVDNGPSPSLNGPTLTVLSAEASPTPEGRPGDGGGGPAPTSRGEDVTEAGSGPGEAPAAGATSSGKPGSGTATLEPAPRSSGGAGEGPDIDDTPQPDPAPEGKGRDGDDGRRRGGAAPLHRSPETSAGAGDRPLEDEPATTDRGELLVLLGVIVTVATIALLGTGWLLASREREDETAAAEAAVALRRAKRLRRSANVMPAHDPVLAALGLDEPDREPPVPVRGATRGASARQPKGPRPPR